MATEALNFDCLSFGDYLIDRADERLIGPGGPVRIGHKAFRVLLALAEQQGRLLTKEALFSTVWDGTIVSESALTSVIRELRRALGDEARPPRYIESVYGRGYRFLPEVGQGAQPPRASRPVGAPRQEPAPLERAAQPPLLYIPAFDDAAVREQQPHLASVLREEILLALSRFRDIRLVSGDAAAVASSGGPRGARDYQLALKLVPYGGALRAFARLCRLGSQAIIWAEQVELPMDGPGADIDRLIRSIVSAALPRMQDDLLCNLPPQPEDVYDLYFHIRLRMRSMQSFAEARDVVASLEELIQRFPEFALAYPLLVRLYDTDYCFTGIGATGGRERALGYQLAHKAVTIDPSEPMLHTTKAWVHIWAGEANLAREHLAVALELNPWNHRRLIELATAFLYLDDLDRAAELLGRCRELTPFATEAPHEEQGLLHLLRGEFQSASEQFGFVRRHHPDDPAGARTPITSELYAVLAAAGAESADLVARVQAWRESMAARWCRAEPLTDARLIEWVAYHEPFQNPARKEWILGLFGRALSAGDGAPERAPVRASPRKESGPSSGEAAARPSFPPLPL